MSNPLVDQDLDLSFLEEIADGSDDFIVESIDMFLSQTPQMLAEIGQHIGLQNWPAAGAAAHKLKPNLGFFGMLTSQAIMQEIETMAKGGMPDSATINNRYRTVKEIIDGNLIRLTQVKAEKSV